MTEPRKATDILLELERKLDTALKIIQTQDMNIKILSNKLNNITEALEKKGASSPQITVEAVAPPRQLPPQVQAQDGRQIPVSSEDKLPLESEPQGFRRTSRPETFAGDDAVLPKAQAPNPRYPVQVPNAPPGRAPGGPPPGREATAVVPAPAKSKIEQAKQPVPEEQPNPVVLQNAVPVMQRVVNAHGKSLFLADVEIIDLSTMQQVTKSRTNATGKWMASLGLGNYRVIVRKLEAASGQRLEVTQDITIDGSQSPLELQTAIIKSS